MFSLRVAFACVHPLLVAFTLALPSAPQNGNYSIPDHFITTHLGPVRCLNFNQYGILRGEELPYETPVEWLSSALTKHVNQLNDKLRKSEAICQLPFNKCETIGCEMDKGGIGWCNESGDIMTIPCHFLAEYVSQIVDVCSKRSRIHSYVNGMIVSRGWPATFSVWAGKPPHPHGCDWDKYERGAY